MIPSLLALVVNMETGTPFALPVEEHDYLDNLHGLLPQNVVCGETPKGRVFVAMKTTAKYVGEFVMDHAKPEEVTIAVHQRYTDNKDLWVMCPSHAAWQGATPLCSEAIRQREDDFLTALLKGETVRFGNWEFKLN